MKKILLVDDTKTVLLLLEIMLKGEGFALATAANGRLALEAVAREPPDLVLLDIMMPELNGIETCRVLKSDERTRAIPVVMLTTKGETARMEEAQKAGCDGYLTKPVAREALLAKVNELLRAADAAGPADCT